MHLLSRAKEMKTYYWVHSVNDENLQELLQVDLEIGQPMMKEELKETPWTHDDFSNAYQWARKVTFV